MSKFDKYPKTEKFSIVDSVTVPHPYHMGMKVMGYISTNFDGVRVREAVTEYEKEFGPSCTMPGCNISIDEHVPALVVEIDSDEEEAVIEGELQEYLSKCMSLAVTDSMMGFVFYRKEKK